MNQSTQFLQSKINHNNHFLNQQQQIQQQQHNASRYIGGLNSNQFIPNTNNLTSSPPGQFNSALSLSLGQQQQQQHLQQNFNPMVSPNMMYANANPINHLNFNNPISQQQNMQQLNNGQSLIASVIAANTTCSLNNTLFVGNLHASLQEIDLVQVFRPFGRIVECCKKWLHFGFVKFTSEEEACHAYVTLNGFRLKGRPMRLEFQNRTKKARIKAILAQAALQASTNTLNGNTDPIESSLANLGFSTFLNENNTSANSGTLKNTEQTNDCSFFDSEHMIKFANSVDSITESEPKKLESFGETQEVNIKTDSLNMNFSFNDKMLGKDLIENTSQEDQMLSSSIKKHISPSESPHHEFSCSLSSSDSGCRSTASFLAEEDSGIASLQTTKSSFTSTTNCPLTISKGKHDSCLTEENLSSFNEELSKKNIANIKSVVNVENDDQDTEILSENGLDEDDRDTDSDTSDDASDIPDSECLDDLASLEDLEDPQGYMDQTAQIFNQVMDKDGTILRKKLDFGIYRSINKTLSLFIEPQDVLKKIDTEEYEEYSLFPNGFESVESYFKAMVM
jgi:RNA recognition motif-containing protein